MNDLALDIYKRARLKGVSISHVCREAGVSRRWIEHFKQRVPKSVEAYIKIDSFLNGQKNNVS